MFPSAPANDPDAAPPAAAAVASPGPKKTAPGPVAEVVHVVVGAGDCANAPELAETAITKAKPAKIRPLRAFNLTVITAPKPKKSQAHLCVCLRQSRPSRKLL